jgi:hypothetical protein
MKLICKLGRRHGNGAKIAAAFVLHHSGESGNDLISELRSESFEFDRFDTVEHVSASTLIGYWAEKCDTKFEKKNSL